MREKKIVRKRYKISNATNKYKKNSIFIYNLNNNNNIKKKEIKECL
jgi:hypothetical protein